MTGYLNVLPRPEDNELCGWPWTEETNTHIYDPNIPWPKMSIITPSFNQGEFIEETIRSILLQNYPNLEYIIIDGGSTDSSFQIIKKYEEWLTYWVSEPDKGQSDAINKGLKLCSGDIFNWLNSDDFYKPGALLRIALKFLEENNSQVISAQTSYLYNDGSTKDTAIFPESNDLFTVLRSSLYVQPSTFYKLQLVKDLGGVNLSLHYVMDWELWIRYILNNGLNNISTVNDSIVFFRIHDESKTTISSTLFEDEIIKVYVGILNNYKNFPCQKLPLKWKVLSIEIDTNKHNYNYLARVFNSFLLPRISGAYGSRKFKKCKNYVDLIIFDQLILKDKLNILNLMFRMLIPSKVFKILDMLIR